MVTSLQILNQTDAKNIFLQNKETKSINLVISLKRFAYAYDYSW